MWAAAVVQKIPLGISIRPQLIILRKNFWCISEVNSFTNFYSKHFKVFGYMFGFDSTCSVLPEHTPFQLSMTSLRNLNQHGAEI